MIRATAQLTRRIIGWQVVFGLGATSLIGFGAPALLLLGRTVTEPITEWLFLFGFIANSVAIGRSWLSLRGHRFILRALSLRSRAVEPHELARLSKEPWHTTVGWTLPHLLVFALLLTPFRPGLLDPSTSLSLYLLAVIIILAASLPLMTLIRSVISGAMELAPPEVMAEVIEESKRRASYLKPIPRRLIVAVATPVLLVALGSTLIATSHIKRAEELAREETARAAARAALEPLPGLVPTAGLPEALKGLRALGFKVSLKSEVNVHRLDYIEGGVLKLTVPLDRGSAIIQFNHPTLEDLAYEGLFITLISVIVAAAAGGFLARELMRDLVPATERLSTLSTDAILRGNAIALNPVRFEPVGELTDSIEQLTERFKIFAGAQERAIEAKSAAARMRGLFFASVSHDLKSPLNAVLGFAELVRQEPLTQGQAESLDIIDQRGRELLALIETILDAARVEAHQLSLMMESVSVGELIQLSLSKAKDLGAASLSDVRLSVEAKEARLEVDQIRLARALATLIAQSLRIREKNEPIWIQAKAAEQRIRIEINVPTKQYTAHQLETLLDPSRSVGTRQHRGLALGLSLVRSVIQLHGGSVRVLMTSKGHSRFRVLLPVVRGGSR